MPDGTELTNIPPQSPLEEDEPSSEDDGSPDEYDTMEFSIARNLGGTASTRTWKRLPVNRVTLPLVSQRPLRYSTYPDPFPGVFNFVNYRGGSYLHQFQWDVFFHCPPCEVAMIQGHTDQPYPDHPGLPMWIPQQNHGTILSYRCNCPLCRRRSGTPLRGMALSQHLWAFTVPARIHLTQHQYVDPKHMLLCIADWVFGHSSERNRTDIRPNRHMEWQLHPVDGNGIKVYKHWFYYHEPVDPLFEGRPTVYIPAYALQDDRRNGRPLLWSGPEIL
jgi:hypothetical protein